MEENSKKSKETKPRSRNPFGRPRGSKNKIALSVKDNLLSYLKDNYKEFQNDMKALKGKPAIRAKLFLDIAKLVTPRPKDVEEEEKREQKMQTLFSRLFPEDIKDDDE